MENNKAVTSKKGTLVYACSGCSDTGELADLIAAKEMLGQPRKPRAGLSSVSLLTNGS